jgi:predicted transcriptional regulator
VRGDGIVTESTHSQPSEAVPRDVADESTESIFAALEKPGCRTVLRVLDAEPRTVRELDDRCSLPASSIYRCLDELVAADLVEETTRLREKGRHPSAYAIRVDSIVIDLSPPAGPVVRLDSAEE